MTTITEQSTNYSIVITSPFNRVCHYEFDSQQEARQFVDTLSILLGFEVTAEVVPSQLLNTYYEA